MWQEARTISPGVATKSTLVALLRNEPMSLMNLVSAFALRGTGPRGAGMNITNACRDEDHQCLQG